MENTKWQIGIEPGNKAVLSYTKVDSGGNPIGGPTPFKIKGICYSPCPIGEDNRVGNNLGDYFWDSFTVGANNEVHIWNWDRLWKPNYDSFGSRNDLDKIAALGINTIRVYSMMAYQMPDPNHFDFSHEFTHSSFLDECYSRGIFVLAGFPLPSAVFFKGQAFDVKKEDWIRNYTQTCKQLSSHPAVIGIVFNNELDGAGTSFPVSDKDDPAVNYFWTEVEAMAKIVKENAPGKLAGMALHDSPVTYTEKNLPNLNLAEHLDFWGVNTYQTISLSSLFTATPATGAIGFNNLSNYNAQYPHVYKPVILTEMGWPSTGHDPAAGKIYSDADTQAKTASFVSNMFRQVFNESLCAGVCYFEYCDEWWSQPGFCTWEWNGGAPARDFPNGFWDIEGFGLYGVEMNPASQIPRTPEGKPINWNKDGNGPFPYFNPLVSRPAPAEALKEIYSSVK